MPASAMTKVAVRKTIMAICVEICVPLQPKRVTRPECARDFSVPVGIRSAAMRADRPAACGVADLIADDIGLVGLAHRRADSLLIGIGVHLEQSW